MNPDLAHKRTDRAIKALSRKIRVRYGKASEEVEAKLNDYFRRFRIKDAKWQKWVDEGKKTAKEYSDWRREQMIVGKRWENLKTQIAYDYRNADKIAVELIREGQAEAYTLNINYATYTVEKALEIDTSFSLYSKDSVWRLLRESPKMLPKPGKRLSKEIAEGKAVRWSKKQLQSIATQAIIQGESIPNIAKRMATELGEKNGKAMIRNARTMMTGAQNAGRVDAYDRARDLGVEVVDAWAAVFDERTREEHRLMNGETRGEDGYFSNGLAFPGDPSGDPAQVYNCRCSIIGQIKGFERDLKSFEVRNDPDVGGMTYDEWVEARPKSRDILHQRDVGK